jgi:WD40 repeat protein
VRSRTALLISLIGAALCVGAIVIGLEYSANPEGTFAVVPNRVWLGDGRQLAEANGLQRNAIYLFRNGRWEPLPWSPSPKRSIGLVAVSPGRDLVAVSGSGTFPTSEPRRGGPLVSVLSLSGKMAREFPGALDFAWSPDGSNLALAFGRVVKDGSPVPERIGIWSVAKDSLVTFDLPAHHLAWMDGGTLLLDYWTHVTALDVRSGRESPTKHRGVYVSPDGKYSISVRPEGAIDIWDEGTGERLTSKIELLLDGARIRTETLPSWVKGSSSGHLLTVPTCRYFEQSRTAAGNRAECSLFLIDAAGPRLVRRIPGQALAISTGAGTALVMGKGGARVEWTSNE